MYASFRGKRKKRKGTAGKKNESAVKTGEERRTSDGKLTRREASVSGVRERHPDESISEGETSGEARTVATGAIGRSSRARFISMNERSQLVVCRVVLCRVVSCLASFCLADFSQRRRARGRPLFLRVCNSMRLLIGGFDQSRYAFPWNRDDRVGFVGTTALLVV